MTTISLAGHCVDGHYSGRCECGFDWTGQGWRYLNGSYEPMLPIAEAIVHHRMEHSGEPVELVFGPHFEHWVEGWFRQFAHIPPSPTLRSPRVPTP